MRLDDNPISMGSCASKRITAGEAWLPPYALSIKKMGWYRQTIRRAFDNHQLAAKSIGKLMMVLEKSWSTTCIRQYILWLSKAQDILPDEIIDEKDDRFIHLRSRQKCGILCVHNAFKGNKTMQIRLQPIGTAHTDAESIPRHWTVSDVEGSLVIDPEYTEGLSDISAGQQIVVLFHFHKSAPFSPALIKQTPPHREQAFGVFSICSPRRPNPIGLSVLTVLARNENVLRVRCMDMIDGTPILDIKPFIVDAENLPSRKCTE